MGRASASERRAARAAALATLGRLEARFGEPAGAFGESAVTDSPERSLPPLVRHVLVAGLAEARARVEAGRSPVSSVRAAISLVRKTQSELALLAFGPALRELSETLAGIKASKAGPAANGKRRKEDTQWKKD